MKTTVVFILSLCPNAKLINFYDIRVIGYYLSSFCSTTYKTTADFFLFISHSLNTEFEHTGMNTGVCCWGRNELVLSCVQSKRKSSYDWIRNCLSFNVWSHLGLNQGLPDYESGALTNWAIGPVVPSMNSWNRVQYYSFFARYANIRRINSSLFY